MLVKKVWDHAIDIKKEKGVSVAERRERRGVRVH